MMSPNRQTILILGSLVGLNAIANRQLCADKRLNKVCCAFELLRLDNYLLQPNIDTVRVLAGLSAILRDQANPAASWSLLGEGHSESLDVNQRC